MKYTVGIDIPHDSPIGCHKNAMRSTHIFSALTAKAESSYISELDTHGLNAFCGDFSTHIYQGI
jgi:hypothetical protein